MLQVENRSQIYGESLFVTLLAVPGKQLLFVEQQWEKLTFEIKSFGLDWDEAIERKKFAKIVDSELKADMFCRVRLNYHLHAPLWPLMVDKNKDNCRWDASCLILPIDFNLDQLPKKKVKPFVRVTDQRLKFNCKIGSLGIETLYYLKNQSKEWNDYLWVDPNQNLQECSTANVFAIMENGTWVTPSTQNCYSGVTRQALIKWLPIQGIEVVEADISIKDLTKVKCLVFTNAIQLFGILEMNGLPKVEPEMNQQLLDLRVKFFLDMQRTTGGKLSL